MNKENNININFTSLVDYMKDKDLEIENWRYKHLKEFKEKKMFQEQLNSIKDYINDVKEEYDNADKLTRSAIGSWHYCKLIEDISELLENHSNE